MRRLTLIGRVAGVGNRLLNMMWDYCRVGVERTAKFGKYVYSVVESRLGFEVHITNESTGHLLGIVRSGMLYELQAS